MGKLRPFKVWNATRSVKKSVAVASLRELVDNGKKKLGMPANIHVTIVLEEDGTEVEENDYLGCLENNTTFLLLKPGEKWTKFRDFSSDETDFTRENMELDSHQIVPQSSMDTVLKLRDRLQENPEAIMALSVDELQDIVDIDVNQLAETLKDSRTKAEMLQETCQRYLDDRIKTSEAMDLLQLYHKAVGVANHGGQDRSITMDSPAIATPAERRLSNDGKRKRKR